MVSTSRLTGTSLPFLLLLCLIFAFALSPALAQQDDGADDGAGGDDSGSNSDVLTATSMNAAPTQTQAPGASTTASSTISAAPTPTYSNVVLDLDSSYQPNFFVHEPLPDAYYGSAAHVRAPDIYFRDCNYHARSGKSVVAPDLRINVTSVYAQFDEDLGGTFIGRRAPTKGTLRIVALGEIGSQAHAADNITNYLSAISIQSNFLTFPVFSNFTFLCDRIFPTTADLLNPLINPASCAYGPGPVAFGVSIPVDSPYYLGTLQTQLRLSDPSKPAKNIACIQISNTPYRPHSWYWSFILWLPIATCITYFVVATLARLLTALAVLRARFANRAREGTGPNWVRDKLRPTLVAALSGEHLQLSAGLLRFSSPGCWDVIYHLQFVAAIAMVSVHWPDWAYPVLRQAAWASLLGNVTILKSDQTNPEALANSNYMGSGKIDVLRTFAALPIGDIGDQMRNNLTSPIFMNTNLEQSAPSHGGGNRFLNLNGSVYGIPRYGYMIGLREEDLWPTAAVIWLCLLAVIVGISALLWLADWVHGILETAKQRRHADDFGLNGTGGSAGAGRGESSTAILAPKSPAGSTAASLNFGANASGSSSTHNRPGTPGGGGGAAPLTSTVRPPSRSSMLDHNRRTISSVSIGAGQGYVERSRHSISDGLGLASGRQTPYEGDAEAKMEVDGHVHSPGSTRWGQYRFLSALGGGSTSEKAGNGTAGPRRSRGYVRGGRAGGAPAKLHLSVLHGNIVRVIALFHLPLTILSVWGFQSHGGAHSTTQQALAAVFFTVVCVLIPLYVVLRIGRSTSEELYEDMPTFIQLGPMYNSYAPGTQKFVVALFAWTLIIGIMIGAAEASGSAQAIVLLIFEVAMSVGSSLWLPWGEGSHMGPLAFVGSVLRIITAVLLVLLSPVVGFGSQVAGWMTYVILLIQAIWFVGALFIVAVKLCELAIRIGFKVPYEEGSRRTYGGLEGAIRQIRQIRRRQDKILQLGSGMSQTGGLRRPPSRGSAGSVLNMGGSPGVEAHPAAAAAAANKPIRLTHSRQVSYASYLDNPRMNQQNQPRMSQHDALTNGPYAGYFQSDPHDEGGIMAAMPSTSPGLNGSSTASGWGQGPATAPRYSPPGIVPQRPRSAQALQHQSVGGGGPSPPATGFVRLGGGRATDAQPWQSIPGTAVTARSPGQPNGSPSAPMPPQNVGALPEGPIPGVPSAATAAAVAAARRRSRPQSQSAVVEFSWADQGGAGVSRNAPSASARNELVALPDHRSSFTAIAHTTNPVPSTKVSDAAGSGAAVGASSAAAAAARKRSKARQERRASGGGGFWMRTKPKRRMSESGIDAENSFDEEDEDEEDEEEEGGEDGQAEGAQRRGAGRVSETGSNNAGGGGGVWSGLKNVVGGLRSNVARRTGGREGNLADEGAFGIEMEGEDDGAAPKSSGFEVVRKPRRPPVVQDGGAPGPSAAGPSALSPSVGTTLAPPQAAPPTGTATPGSPIGDGSLPPQTDLGKLNAGLGLDFNASLASSNGVGSPRNSVLAAVQNAGFGSTTAAAATPSEGAAPGSERKPASNDPAYWRS
ncbi:unnamed protein product [Tilletia laevis]|uniref:TRP C-terminal domain-containing protein n=2 Tax=Tilletia TaxID=13289 RepID=A0A9N8LM75_9BASI|nr:hypothetical protein A4X03_0g4314 [Tilletia caries]CAD6901326.1 unnamed protein product [Tilletia caries]CAD6917620.1 unnamed protein product [Tilletia laevis]